MYTYLSCLRCINLSHSHRDQRVNASWKAIVMYSLNYRMQAIMQFLKFVKILLLGHVVEVVKTALEDCRVTL